MILPSPSPGFLIAAEAEAPAFVYALGRIEPRFPNAAVAAAVVEALRRSNGENLNGQRTLSLLSESENRHLLRQVCWVLSGQGAPRYLLNLGSLTDFEALFHLFLAGRLPSQVDVRLVVAPPVALPEVARRPVRRLAALQPT